MSSTLKELAVGLSQKQTHMVDSLTEESPILERMHFEPSSHGLWNAYEEVNKIHSCKELFSVLVPSECLL